MSAHSCAEPGIPQFEYGSLLFAARDVYHDIAIEHPGDTIVTVITSTIRKDRE